MNKENAYICQRWVTQLQLFFLSSVFPIIPTPTARTEHSICLFS